MALARVKSWTNEVLSATDLNAEFNNILNSLNASNIGAVDALSLASNDFLQWSGTAWANKTPTATLASLMTNGQVPFPASQNPSADANTLDDYEEGTFTPSLAFGGGTTGMTFATRLGNYIKVGKLVTVSLQVQFSNKGSDTGVATITALPFTSISTGPNTSFNVVGNSLQSSASGQLIGLVSSNATVAGIYQFSSGGIAQLTNADFANSSVVWSSFSYEASA